MKLENKVSIITGGAKGMGRDISLTLAREGADLVLAARGARPAILGRLVGEGSDA